MTRIWNKHKQSHPVRKSEFSNGTGTPFKPRTGSLRVRRRVFVAMSGGVDSSVAALLLKKQGYDVVGVFMRCFNLDGCQDRDAEDARRVAAHLGIPFYVWDFEEDYKRRVVDYMIDGYRRGITPNPDVMCNKEIKFGLFFEKARSMGADYVATGHYVCLVCGKLYCAKDKNKDQSYFLWTLTQEQLKHCLFPISDHLKPEVREIARRAGLPTAEKKDSQGICFLGKVALGDFLKKYIKPKRGDVVTLAGKKIGEHDGAYFYTIGQRHGIGVGGGTPYYVAEKNVRGNLLVVADGSKNPALYRKEIELKDVNFINDELRIRNSRLRVFARVRYRQPLARAMLLIAGGAPFDKPLGRELGAERLRVRLIFDQSQKFVAAGQSVVFYTEESNPSRSSGHRSRELRMLGGGIIS